jgi:hypothetical protein
MLSPSSAGIYSMLALECCSYINIGTIAVLKNIVTFIERSICYMFQVE